MCSTLRQEIEQERYHQKLFLDKRQCSCCEQPLGLIFNSGANCPNCVNLVCKQCRKTFSKPPPKFICTVCAKQRYVVLQLSKAGFKNFMVDWVLTVLIAQLRICKCTYPCVHKHTLTQTVMYANIHLQTLTYTYKHLHTLLHKHTLTYTLAHTNTRTCIHIRTHTHPAFIINMHAQTYFSYHTIVIKYFHVRTSYAHKHEHTHVCTHIHMHSHLTHIQATGFTDEGVRTAFRTLYPLSSHIPLWFWAHPPITTGFWRWGEVWWVSKFMQLS